MVMLHNFLVETVVGSHLQAAVTMKAANGDTIFKDIGVSFPFYCLAFLLMLICHVQVPFSIDVMP